MKTTLSILCFLTLFSNHIRAQSDSSSVYGPLKKVKFYAVSLSYSSEGGKDKYQVNDKNVSKHTYDKYERKWKDLEDCCPCILQSYDEDDILLHEAVACGDCYVGHYKEFYPNGQIKSSGSFKENDTGNWANIYDRGYCAVPNGQWNYYDKSGNLLYSEYWSDGDFLRQVPEQNKTEIWRVDLLLNNEPVNNLPLLPNQLKDLIITPRFKNAARDNVHITLELTATAIGRKVVQHICTPETFKSFDLNQALLNNGFTSDDSITYRLMVKNKDSYIGSFPLNIQPDLPKAPEKIAQKSDSTLIADYDYGFDSDIFLIHSIDSTKRVKLVPKIAYSMSYSEATDDTVLLQKSLVLEGYIRKENQRTVTFDIHKESIYMAYSDGMDSEIYNDYSYALREIPIENIDYLAYQSPSRYTFMNIGGAATFLSIVTAAVVAPLVSINYQNGDFNQDRYYSVAGAGLIGLSVGIPLFLFSQFKTYTITERNSHCGKDLWYFHSQPKRR